MSYSRRLFFLSTIHILCVSFIFAQNSQVLQNLKINSASSIVKIYAKHDDTTFSGTGFLWPDSSHVVTSLHLVANSKDIQCYYEGEDKTLDVKIVRVLKDFDLALLQLPNRMKAPPLRLAKDSPTPHSVFYALGYLVNIPKLGDFSGTVSIIQKKLIESIPQQFLDSIIFLGYPNPNISVILLQGGLGPGLSGCPLFNESGEVIGIGDGGLDAGATSITFAIPVSQLEVLWNSKENITQKFAKSEALFQSEALQDIRTPIARNFVYTKTKSLLEVKSYGDDLAGLTNLLQIQNTVLWNFGFDPILSSKTKFDIYQDYNNGALLFVPSGSVLTEKNDVIVATLPTSNAYLEFSLNTFENSSGAYAYAITIEKRLLGLNFESKWIPNMPLTYRAPMYRPDEVQVTRKSFIVNPSYRPALPKYAEVFENFSLKGATLFSISAANLTPPDSYVNEDQIKNWFSLVLSAHLSSFAQ